MSKLFLSFIFLFTLVSCKTFEITDVKPYNDPVSPKLLTLEERIEEVSNVVVTANDVDIMIFTKEVEQNLCDIYGKKVGYINFSKRKIRGADTWGEFGILGGLTMGAAYILGMPTAVYNYEIEITIKIYDLNNRLIRKFTEIGKHKIVTGLYYKWYSKGANLEAYTSAINDALNKIRNRIKSDVTKINEQLKSPMID